MNRKQKLRYLLAIYLIVALIAIVLGFLAFNQIDIKWQSLLLNLSTELLGVVLVFLLVNITFLLGEWDLSDQVAALVRKLQTPSATDFFKKTPSPGELQKHIQDAKRIDFCGVTLTATINRSFSDLRQKIFDGTDVRIMIISPTMDTLQEAAKRSESGIVEYYQNRLESTLTELEYLHKNRLDYNKTHKTKAGNLTVGLLPYTPSFGLLSFQSVSNNRIIFVELYPHHRGYDTPANFVLTPEDDGNWYVYFSTQFEEMWKKTTRWDPETGKKTPD